MSGPGAVTSSVQALTTIAPEAQRWLSPIVSPNASINGSGRSNCFASSACASNKNSQSEDRHPFETSLRPPHNRCIQTAYSKPAHAATRESERCSSTGAAAGVRTAALRTRKPNARFGVAVSVARCAVKERAIACPATSGIGPKQNASENNRRSPAPNVGSHAAASVTERSNACGAFAPAVVSSLALAVVNRSGRGQVGSTLGSFAAARRYQPRRRSTSHVSIPRRAPGAVNSSQRAFSDSDSAAIRTTTSRRANNGRPGFASSVARRRHWGSSTNGIRGSVGFVASASAVRCAGRIRSHRPATTSSPQRSSDATRRPTSAWRISSATFASVIASRRCFDLRDTNHATPRPLVSPGVRPSAGGRNRGGAPFLRNFQCRQCRRPSLLEPPGWR